MSICQGRPVAEALGSLWTQGSWERGHLGAFRSCVEAEQPRARPEERLWLRTRPCYLQPTSQKAEGEVPGVKGGPLPASPQRRCVFRGQRVPYMWRAPAWKGRGPGSNSKVFQAWAEAKFSCLGTRLAGGLGESKEAVHSLSRKKGLVTEGQEPGLGRMPVAQALPRASVQGIQRPRHP